MPIGPFLVASSKARYAADLTTPRLQTSAISCVENAKILRLLPAFNSAPENKGGKISFTLSTQLLVLISHISHAGALISSTSRRHDCTTLQFHKFMLHHFTLT